MTPTLPQPWPTNPWPTQFRTVRASNSDGLPAGGLPASGLPASGLPASGLPDGMVFVTVNSPALGGRGDMAVYTPPSAVGRAAPLVLLLHGVFGSFWNWAFLGGAHRVLDAAIAAGDVQPMVLAMPSDGHRAEGTGYLAHPTFDVERWIIDDVPACVAEMADAVGSVSVRTEQIFLCGNSMGGFGALRLAARFPHRCAAAVGLSSITHLDELAAFTVDDIGVTAGLADSERGLADVIARSSAMPPFAFDCGTADPLIDSNRLLHRVLDERGIGHRYDEHSGDHSWSCWPDRLAIAFEFFQSQLAGA